MSAQVLPAIREDLRLMPGSADEDGAPRWFLFDAMRNRYFALSKDGMEIVRHWRAGISSDAMGAELQRAGNPVSSDEIEAFANFLTGNHLVRASNVQASAKIDMAHASGELGFWHWLLHNYLFFRIPLARPDRWLSRWTPRLAWLFADATHYLVLLLGILGIAMILQRWDEFAATFMHFFNVEGLVFYALALVSVKSVHELAHAFVCRRLGCRVASMGIAFLVMFPVLYTDTTDAWRLRSRAARLRIVTAGVRAELYLALLATFCWNVLPDGPLRSAAFFVATTSWLTSLLINVSPFLRFDGYYALSDIMGIENLQPRAFAVGRWQLRRLIWGFDDPLPEPMPRQRLHSLVVYAWATWIYRLILFLGIALLVYHLFFKVLGIILFVVEIAWFIAMPIAREIRIWWLRRACARWSPQRILGWLTMGTLVAWAIVPRDSTISIPAILHAGQVHVVFAPEPSKIAHVAVDEGEVVKRGQVLLGLASDEIEFELAKLDEILTEAHSRIGRIAASAQDKAQQAILQREIARLNQRQQGLMERQHRLQLRAPFDAVATRIDNLKAGQWVNYDEPIVQLVSPERARIEGFVNERELPSVEVGQLGIFMADRVDVEPLSVEIGRVDISAVRTLPYPELASLSGGRIAVRQDQDGNLRPEAAHYRLDVLIDKPVELPLQRFKGVMLLNGPKRSWAWHNLKRLAAPLIRESGF